MQDDEKDWARESQLMSIVYGNSSMNIAAAGATDGSQGCFFYEDPKRINKLQINVLDRGQLKTYEGCPSSIYECCVPNTPLASRAWVLQERLLAPRTLHFSKTQLFWECNKE